MQRRTTMRFSTCHPVVLLVYALVAPGLGMLSNHPAYLAVNLVMAAVVHGFYQGAGNTFRRILKLFPVLLVITVFNCCVNSRGMHVLFRIGNRPFTWESLMYGLANGVMLLLVLLWFSCFQQMISNEKFLYLFGQRLPGTALLLSMILKLFPDTRYRMQCIRYADREPAASGKEGIGKGIKKGLRQVLTLMEWSMEDSIEMADSMKARGYGEGKRTCYQTYRFRLSDVLVLIWFAFAAAVCLTGMFGRGTEVRYFPAVEINGNSEMLAVSCVVYVLFLATPLLAEGSARWRH